MTLNVKLTAEEVETLARYNEKVGFPIDNIFCEFRPEDADELEAFYMKCVDKIKKVDTLPALEELIASVFGYKDRSSRTPFYRLRGYLANLRTKRKDNDHAVQNAPNLMVLVFLCDASRIALPEVLSIIKTIRFRSMRTTGKNLSSKIIKVLLELKGPATVEDITLGIDRFFNDRYSEKSVQGACYSLENSGFLIQGFGPKRKIGKRARTRAGRARIVKWAIRGFV